MFEPRLALASLSGESDAQWAKDGAPWAGMAFLGGIAIDGPTRSAARTMVADRDRSEFLPEAPLDFVDRQFRLLADSDIEAGVNVRASRPGPLRKMAQLCQIHNAVLEINAHCRQAEMTDLGVGQALLRDLDRLQKQVRIASEAGATVSVKVRTEVSGVSLPAVAESLETAGVDMLHVDAMDSEPVIADIVNRTDAFVIANNDVRDRETVREYLDFGADAVSVGRPSDEPAVLERVHAAIPARE